MKRFAGVDVGACVGKRGGCFLWLWLGLWLGLGLGLWLATPATCLGQDPGLASDPVSAKPSRYPLRLHILAIDATHRTVRLQPNWCSGSLPETSGGESAPCSNQGSASLGGGEDDFSGAGRADLVTPPSGTAGLNFTYEGCSRARVPVGFQGLEARWNKPGSRLEVLLPEDAPTDGRVLRRRCTLKVVPQEFVYLRLPNGALIRVSQQAYTKKPSLRVFLSGVSETLERRTPESRASVVSVKELLAPVPPPQ